MRCNPLLPRRGGSSGATRATSSCVAGARGPGSAALDDHRGSDHLSSAVDVVERADYPTHAAAYFDGAVKLEQFDDEASF